MGTQLPLFGTKEEAHICLEEVRKKLIADARSIAVMLCRLHGETTTHYVREEMAAQGLLSPEFREFWMGCVFNNKQFEWTGKWGNSLYTNKGSHFGRRTSNRAVRIWKLRDYPEKQNTSGVSDE